jgi:hypothetical protein
MGVVTRTRRSTALIRARRIKIGKPPVSRRAGADQSGWNERAELPAHHCTTQASAIGIESGRVLRKQLQDTKRSFGILLLLLDIPETGRYALRDGRFNLRFRL